MIIKPDRLSVIAKSRSRSGVIHWPLLAKTSSITLSGIHRFELSLLSRRDEVSVLLKIFDDFFADHFTLKATQRTFDRFVITN